MRRKQQRRLVTLSPPPLQAFTLLNSPRVIILDICQIWPLLLLHQSWPLVWHLVSRRAITRLAPLSLGIKKPLFVSEALTNAPSSSPQSIHPSVYPCACRSTRLPASLPACLSARQRASWSTCFLFAQFDSIEPLQRQGGVHVAARTQPLPLTLPGTHRRRNTASAHCSFMPTSRAQAFGNQTM